MIKLYRKYLKYYKKEVILGPLFKLLEAIFELIVPLIMASIIDKGINLNNTTYIFQMGGVLFLVAIVGFCSTLICQYFASKTSQGIGTKIRDDLFKHIESLDFNQITLFGTSKLLTRINNDINQVQLSVAMLIRLVIRAPFIVIGAIVMAFMINLYAGLIFLLVGLLVLFSALTIMYLTIPKNKVVQKDLEKVTTIAKENLNGIRVVKAFNQEDYENNRLQEATKTLNKDANRVARIAALLNPLAAILIAIAILAILKLSGNLVFEGIISQGDVTALVNYLNQILVAIFVVCNLIQIFGKAFSSAARLNELFDTKPQIEYGNIDIVEEQEIVYDVKNLSFSYENTSKPSIDDVSFQIKQGDFVGIIGSTGSGKSTLLHLLARYYESSKGSIYFNGKDIASYTKLALNNNIGFVFQKTLLANMSIRDNLKLKDKSLSDDKLYQALEIAQANFVLNDEEGLDKIIYQGGKNLSGGERQRISIARALAVKPQVLFLDDSLSALDFKTDYNLRKALNQLNITIILVTERINQIKDANQILVLDDGKLVAKGQHEVLLKTSKIYKEIYDSQNAEA